MQIRRVDNQAILILVNADTLLPYQAALYCVSLMNCKLVAV